MEQSPYYTFHFNLKRISYQDKSFFPLESQRHHYPTLEDAFLQLFAIAVKHFDRRSVIKDKLDHLALQAYITAPFASKHIAELKLGYADSGHGLSPHFVISKLKAVALDDAVTNLLTQHGVKALDTPEIPIAHYTDEQNIVDLVTNRFALEQEIRMRNKAYIQLEVRTTKPPTEPDSSLGEVTHTNFHSTDMRECFYHLTQLDLSNFSPEIAARNNKEILNRATMTGPFFETELMDVFLLLQGEHGMSAVGDAVFLSIKEDNWILTHRRLPELNTLMHTGNGAMLLASRDLHTGEMNDTHFFREIKVNMDNGKLALDLKRPRTARTIDDVQKGLSGKRPSG